jgi:hypothetical protein
MLTLKALAIISGTGDAICTVIAVVQAMVDDSTSISWGQCTKFLQLSGRDDFYVLLFGVMYLAWCDIAMDPTANVHHILWKFQNSSSIYTILYW